MLFAGVGDGRSAEFERSVSVSARDECSRPYGTREATPGLLRSSVRSCGVSVGTFWTQTICKSNACSMISLDKDAARAGDLTYFPRWW